MSLQIKSLFEGTKFILLLEGVLDISTVESFKGSLENTTELQEVSIDCLGLSFIDSTGVSGLIEVIKYFQDKQVCIKIINILPDINEVFDLLGLKEIFGENIFEVNQN